MAVEIEHLSHDHPLMLIKKEETDDSWDLTCYGCQQPISRFSSSYYYGCKRCRFFLDKTCGELPLEITHPSHPSHPLTLLPNPPPKYISWSCDVCYETCTRFIYHCFNCEFDIDPKCASVVLDIQQSIKLTCHQHPLIPLEKSAVFFCDACCTKHGGTSYLCTTCGFWINQECASPPRIIKLDDHHHSLPLIYTTPCIVELRQKSTCQICFELLRRNNWAYYCSECNYIVHINCAQIEILEYSRDCKTETGSHDLDSSVSGKTAENIDLSKIQTIKIKAKGLDPDLIHLPEPDESVDMVTQFIKSIRIPGKYKESTKIKHACHDHLLTFIQNPIAIDSCSTSNLPFLNEAKNGNKCNGCAQTISAPFYQCVDCNFFLHEWCAELPDELQHPGHLGHPLVLTTNLYPFPCSCCSIYCNAFILDCSVCYFNMDIKCASLPRVIKHEAHKHTLGFKPTSSAGSCRSCLDFSKTMFGCEGCQFQLCARCVLLPPTVRHKYDKHPFILTYSPLPYETDDDFCEICEEHIDSSRWFYHCGHCDQSLHTDCILPVDRCSNVVYGSTITIKNHPHPLTSIQTKKDSLCSFCERNMDYYLMAFECSPCKFCICYLCLKRNTKNRL